MMTTSPAPAQAAQGCFWDCSAGPKMPCIQRCVDWGDASDAGSLRPWRNRGGGRGYYGWKGGAYGWKGGKPLHGAARNAAPWLLGAAAVLALTMGALR